MTLKTNNLLAFVANNMDTYPGGGKGVSTQGGWDHKLLTSSLSDKLKIKMLSSICKTLLSIV